MADGTTNKEDAASPQPPKSTDATHTKATADLNLNRQAEAETPKPKRFFFYGSLMDPDVLYAIARTSATKPELQRATIRGFRMKKWGCYPTIVPAGAGDIIHGVYWEAENEGQLALLQRYETHRYKPDTCAIHVEKDGIVIDDGLTFVWAGDPGSKELEDGEFSLEEYQLYYKPDTFKRTS
ncbi:hypothetical protein DHEL01_v204962 [Diaporthe helianthi]|uniref:Putative gamma-glutamylcyclotransferase n=1 Tax=Diaporthe helianthi TaxID=158607 RepID=A0A2P5I2D5_DIAHE|nr:hypothetical protein DHEL01_v204962 [Diaporthe helianthi]